MNTGIMVAMCIIAALFVYMGLDEQDHTWLTVGVSRFIDIRCEEVVLEWSHSESMRKDG